MTAVGDHPEVEMIDRQRLRPEHLRPLPSDAVEGCLPGGGGNEKVGDAWRPMLPPVRQQHLNLDGPVLGGRGEVLDGHGRQR